MNARLENVFLIITIFAIVLTLLLACYQGPHFIVDVLFIVGVSIFIIGIFIATGFSRYAVRRASLYAYYRTDEYLKGRKQQVKTGLFIIVIGVTLMLVSIAIWEMFKHSIF